MRWLQSEYLLKGIFLGLLLFVALQAAVPPEPGQPPPGWAAVGRSTLLTFGGLSLALVIAGARKLREGYQVRGRLPAFLIFLLLESPTMVYGGTILGLTAAALILRTTEQDTRLLITTAVGGALLGVLFGGLRQVANRMTRLGLSLLLAVVLVVGGLAWLGQLTEPLAQLGLHLDLPKSPLSAGAHLAVFSVQVLLGLPIFYLLTFAGKQEETEVEIGAICAALGLGMSILMRDLPPGMQSLAFFIPVVIYFMYTMKVLPGLRVFKHALRGLSYLQIGRLRNALLSFRRALQLDPHNQLARDGYWRVHCALDLHQLANDPNTLALVDFDVCLNRAGSLLLQPHPSPERLQEAHRLIDLVLSQRPTLGATAGYWRAVAHTHAHELDQAAANLEQILDPGVFGPDDPHRQAILFQAWQLALLLHDELRKRVGLPQLAQAGRRMEAIATVERHLANNPDDATAWNLKRLLYQDVTEAEYDQAAASGPPGAGFDHAYVQQLGLALVNDPNQWRRGAEYLQLAIRGLPELGPSLFIQIAQAHQQAEDSAGAWQNYERAKQAGLAVGPQNLSEEDRQVFYATVKMLGDAALAHEEIDRAIDNYRLYVSEKASIDTLRTLADLYERKGEVLAALHSTELALQYNAKDPDLLERKDRYYYSLMPDTFREHPEVVPAWFDGAYCVNKARMLMGARELDLDTLDWAQHLAELAFVVKPENIVARVLLARAKLRRGEREEAVALLEELYTNKPEKFPSGDDEDAWFVGCRMLGDLYLQELNRPDLAVSCYNDYRKNSKSGADTFYKMGQAYEMLGDRARATKCYEQVTAYESHPLAPEAREALYRMQAPSQ